MCLILGFGGAFSIRKEWKVIYLSSIKKLYIEYYGGRLIG